VLPGEVLRKTKTPAEADAPGGVTRFPHAYREATVLQFFSISERKWQRGSHAQFELQPHARVLRGFIDNRFRRKVRQLITLRSALTTGPH